jgi:DNA-binding MarR family transcriptional regulator
MSSSTYAGRMSRSGADLALLLLAGYRSLVEDATSELAARGYDDFRPAHEFAMRAIASGADSASSLGRRLSVSKQAAAKTIAVLVEREYVESTSDPHDARRKRLVVTPRGREVMSEGEAIFEALYAQWTQALGAPALADLEANLARVVGDRVVNPDSPGWVAQELD